MRRTAVLALVFSFLSGCASAPKIDYYTLGMESSGRTKLNVNLSVERLRATDALGRSQLMILVSPTTIDYYATDHWAGSLGELVQQKLAAEFGPPIEGRETLKVSGKVLACEQVDGPDGTQARVKLNIVVRDAETPRYQAPLLEKSYSSARPVANANPGSVVAQLSRCIEDIAKKIADDLNNQ